MGEAELRGVMLPHAKGTVQANYKTLPYKCNTQVVWAA